MPSPERRIAQTPDARRRAALERELREIEVQLPQCVEVARIVRERRQA